MTNISHEAVPLNNLLYVSLYRNGVSILVDFFLRYSSL